MVDLQDQAIRQHCKTLRMPTIGGQFARLAEAAAREGQSHVGYLEALLAAETDIWELWLTASRVSTMLEQAIAAHAHRATSAVHEIRFMVADSLFHGFAIGRYITSPAALRICS